MSYTPGPWKVVAESVVVDEWVADFATEADARLVAAAPDLLEAAANLLAALAVEGAGPNGVTWYQLADVYGYVERLETAIAKAEGRA